MGQEKTYGVYVRLTTRNFQWSIAASILTIHIGLPQKYLFNNSSVGIVSASVDKRHVALS
jgi:hypothetical protein